MNFAMLNSMAEYRILIVDDEPKVAFFFQKHLEMGGDGYEAVAVNSGAAALAALQQRPFDLMITDLRMPQMDGLELLRQAREISPQTQTILVTAYGSEDVWDQAQKLDIFRALSKPLKIPELLTAVRDALAAREEKGSEKSGLIVLSGERFITLAKRTEQLRIDMGARACILADTTGNILVQLGTVEEFDITSMVALLGANIAASVELSRRLRYPKTVHLSYYEGPPYDLYVVNISDHFFLTVLHDRRKENSRIGYIWLYMRRALDEMSQLLGQEGDDANNPILEQGFADSLKSELDNLFLDDAPSVETAVPTPSAPSTSDGLPIGTSNLSTDQDTLAIKMGELLRQFSRRTGITVESDLAGLNVCLPANSVALIFRTMTIMLKNLYLQEETAAVQVIFLRNQSAVLHGEISGRRMKGTILSAEDLRLLQPQYQKLGGSLAATLLAEQGASISIELP